MITLFDIMRRAQNGAGFDNLSRQFGLSADQTHRAVEALLPAFSLGLFRNAQNPNAFGHLLGLMGSGQYAPFFDMMSWPGQAGTGGDRALGQLLGSPDVARQVAAQASAMTGIGVDVLRRMMPAMAAILMGGLFRFASLEGFADLLRQWSDALLAAQRSATGQAAPASPFDPFAMWAAATAGAGTKAPASPESLASAWVDLMGAMLGAPPPAPKPPPPPPGVVETMFKMFETGQEVQARYMEDLRTIFDRAPATSPGA